MTFEEKDESGKVLFMNHQMWCDWWINDEYESCDCGFREDLYVPEEWEDHTAYDLHNNVWEILHGHLSDK